MFSSLRRTTMGRLLREARQAIQADQPIPLTTYVALEQAGVDITEFERNTRNGV